MLSYEDAAAACDWLMGAFGFRERLRYAEADGVVTHAELVMGGDDAVVMLATPTRDYRGPRRHAEACEEAARWMSVPYVIDGVLVYVDDIDEHFRRAEAAGATILSPVEDTPYGDRHYRAEDLEGHRWMFAQHIRDVAAEEWGATRSEEPRTEPSPSTAAAATIVR